MINLKDGLSDELNTRINLKVKWILRGAIALIFLSVLITCALIGRDVSVELSERAQIEQSLKENYNIRRRFRQTPTTNTYGTYWDHCGVTISAGHVHVEMGFTPIQDALGPVKFAPGVIDAVFYGDDWTCGPPVNPVDGQRIWIAGYPGSSDTLALRRGAIYLKRSVSGSDGYQLGTYIVVFDPKSLADFLGEPVATGMSGGIAVDENLAPIGILATRNDQFDSDDDGEPEQGSDIVGLYDAYQALIE